MKAAIDPPRLRDGNEVGPLLKGLDEHENVLPTEAFEAVRMAIHRRMALELPAPPLPQGIGGKLVGTLVVLGAALGLVAGLYWFAGADSVRLDHALTKQASPVAAEMPARPENPATEVPVEVVRTLDPQSTLAEDSREEGRPARRAKKRSTTQAGQNHVPTKATRDKVSRDARAKSSLAEELTMYEQATALAKSGAPGRAVDVLERLVREYPRTVLLQEIALARIQFLVAAERPRRALGAIEEWLRSGAKRNKRGELARLAGDLYAQEGECNQAVRSYELALSILRTKHERAAAERGVAACKKSDRLKGPVLGGSKAP